MNDYTPNSHKFREEQKKNEIERKRVDKVTSGSVKIKKRSGFGRMIADDIVNVKDYLLNDVILPLVKRTICDIFEDVPRMLLYGDSRRPDSRTTVDKVSYTKYSKNRSDYRDRNEPRSSNVFNYDQITLTSRGEAEKVLTRMDEMMETYGLVRVADLYDMLGETCDYPGNDYGWTNIRNAKVVAVRDGYTIKLPRAMPID